MPKTQTSSLTTIQALDRAHWMIDSGQKLNQAARTLSEVRGDTARKAADQLKEHQLLSYRVSTVPDALVPVLEALIEAASGAHRPIATIDELDMAGRRNGAGAVYSRSSGAPVDATGRRSGRGTPCRIAGLDTSRPEGGPAFLDRGASCGLSVVLTQVGSAK